MKLRCLLVDDEPPAIDVLRAHIASIPLLEMAGECHHAMAAFDFLQRNPVDLLFLDVRMPQMLGTELVKSLLHPPKVIFTTAHREFAFDGFELEAIDFLLKPISLDRLMKAVQKAVGPDLRPKADHAQADQRKFLYFRVNRKMTKILVDEILFIESLKDYVRIHGATQTLVTKQTITSVEEMLPEDEFIRIHRSFIVAADKVSSFSGSTVFVGKHELPIGPLYKNEVAKRLSAYALNQLGRVQTI